ncbi:MAG: DUF3822 family protein [Flavobacteriaceae bacterium]
MANYLKFNAKILANDHIVFDELKSNEMVNVYVPFTNINNYIFDLFGAFEFQHHGTIMIQSLMKLNTQEKETITYVHVHGQEMDIALITNRKLLLYNSFGFNTKEDFLYYLLFVLEQLDLDPHGIVLKFFGDIEEGDENYELCKAYIKRITLFVPPINAFPMYDPNQNSIDFAMLSTL